MKKTVFLFLSVMAFGGQERFASRLSQMLSDKYNVCIVLFDASTISFPVQGTILDIKRADFSATSFSDRVKKTLVRCSRLRKFFKQYKPIACLSFGDASNLINLICKKQGIKVLPSIRGFVAAERISQSPFTKLLYRRADRIICVSKGIEHKLREDVPGVSDKLAVLYNGYDCEEIFAKSQEGPVVAKKTMGPHLVSVGTLRPEKGYWHLIKAVFVLKKTYPDIHLSIVGRDYQQNGENLKSLVKLLNLEENVTFEDFHENPYRFIRASDVYVLASVREGFPNALVEAMACQVPVVAADCLTGPREILSEKPYESLAEDIELAEYGVLVPRLTKEEDYSDNILPEEELLAQAIAGLLNDPALRQEYAQRAADRAAQFSYSACCNQVIKLLEGEDK